MIRARPWLGRVACPTVNPRGSSGLRSGRVCGAVGSRTRTNQQRLVAHHHDMKRVDAANRVGNAVGDRPGQRASRLTYLAPAPMMTSVIGRFPLLLAVSSRVRRLLSRGPVRP